MKITVIGLWHLGCVTAACAATRFRVTGLDEDSAIISGLLSSKPPIFEPGLDVLIADGLASGDLSFTTDAAEACGDADILWLCADTPVDENDRSDTEAVLMQLRAAMSHFPAGKLVIISSQLPVGTCARLEAEFPGHHFACCPENLRLGKSIEVFTHADRYVVGLRDSGPKDLINSLLSPFTGTIIYMRTESAEVVKHSINSFLALSITFINEIARVCELSGADAKEVSAGLKSDIRIGQKAYLGPGGPFAGGTLARDVLTLDDIASAHGEDLVLIRSIKRSNDAHRTWALRRMKSRLGSLSGKSVAILGLTYKPGTDTLRRSSAVELCHALAADRCQVKVYDPVISSRRPELGDAVLCHSAREALEGVDATVLCTEWPEFRNEDWADLAVRMKAPIFIDANRYLEKQLVGVEGAELISVGRL
ncbi:MAG: UDP-glucose/GDP-mannose dehydrogenase family protein [Verrucomicrobiaceae bacterium]|nr:MAG: UDP-glucose/GDP-mannose dehydrogenase family protein [Verrucomicrobiaceae bacterium]